MKTAPLPEFVETVRTGSHNEYRKYDYETGKTDISTTPKKGYWRQIVEEHETRFHDCLPGKKWLELHYKDEYPEPTIDVIIDGKSNHFNGNYKKGDVKDLMALYTTKVRIGRRCVNLDVGEADRVTSRNG